MLGTSGGRVIAASAIADSLEDAVKKAYKGIETIHFDNMYYRKDIAHRSVAKFLSMYFSLTKVHRAFKKTSGDVNAMTYEAAGVSLDAGNLFVENIKAAVKSTKRPGADADIGGFGGTCDLESAGYTKPPVLIAAIDGVGTKLKIAHALGKHYSVGIDLVAMNVNDLVVQGAEALMFLDYYACSKLDVKTAAGFVGGVAEGCRQAGCALVGGETAEMPGMYTGSDYDVAG